jgi:hypothetical protein
LGFYLIAQHNRYNTKEAFSMQIYSTWAQNENENSMSDTKNSSSMKAVLLEKSKLLFSKNH